LHREVFDRTIRNHRLSHRIQWVLVSKNKKNTRMKVPVVLRRIEY